RPGRDQHAPTYSADQDHQTQDRGSGHSETISKRWESRYVYKPDHRPLSNMRGYECKTLGGFITGAIILAIIMILVATSMK
ncbi:hypothetical protein ACWGLF_45765, partial [Streptomyces puniciscabiei]